MVGDRLWVAVLPNNSPNGNLVKTLMGEGKGKDLPPALRLNDFSMGMGWTELPDHNGVGKKVPGSGHVQEVSLCFAGVYEGTSIHGSMPLQEYQQKGGLANIITPVAAAASKQLSPTPRDWAWLPGYDYSSNEWEWPSS